VTAAPSGGRHDGRAAVLGSPIAHSLSPALHRAAYASMGLDWSYEAIECDESRLPGLLSGLGNDVVGLSLTMPLKRAVLPLADRVSDLAAAVGAANTLVFTSADRGRRSRAENTDVGGIADAVEAVGAGGAALTVLGAGGTAAAALGAACDWGLSRARVVVRDPSRAADLAAAASRLGVVLDLVRWDDAPAALATADLVISTVPADAAGRLAASWSPAPGQVLFDVVYHPWPTPIAAAAAIGGATVIDGLELLVRQAALQIELWSGRRPALDVMRAAGEAALRERVG
jgi:shikimate dehydrogenase